MNSHAQNKTGTESTNTETCEKHNTEKNHTGGNIWICPECEAEDMKENPEKYQNITKENVEKQNQELLEEIKEE